MGFSRGDFPLIPAVSTHGRAFGTRQSGLDGGRGTCGWCVPPWTRFNPCSGTTASFSESSGTCGRSSAGRATSRSRPAFSLQWYATEKRKEVIVPASFWWLSLAGSWLLLSYAIFSAKNSVFIFANAFSWIPTCETW